MTEAKPNRLPVKWRAAIFGAIVADCCRAIALRLRRLTRPAQEVQTNDRIEALAVKLQSLPQIDMPVTHRFAPGLYLREIFMPAGTFVMGAEHKTEHFNIVLTGRAKVSMEDKVVHVKAGDVFLSGAGVRKVLEIQEDMRWLTTHVTRKRDIQKIERAIFVQTDSWLHRHRSPDIQDNSRKQISL